MRMMSAVKSWVVAAALAVTALGAPGGIALAGVYGRSGGGAGSSAATGTRVTAGSDQASLAINSLTGTTDGGYELEGEWYAGTAGDTNLLMRINGVSTGYTTGGTYAGSIVASNLGTAGLGSGSADTSGIDVVRCGGNSGRDRCVFRVRVSPSDASGSYQITISSYAFASATGAAQETFDLKATIVSPTGITSISFVTSNGSSTGIKAGSFVRWRPLKFTA